MKKIQLTIPEPCHENWDKMTSSEKGRFCGSCQKTVVDFSQMSDREIAEFFKKPPSKVCGHFNRDQLDREITLPKKRIPWIKYLFQFSLPAFLMSAKARAQGQVVITGDTICMPSDTARLKDLRVEKKNGVVEGIVTDENGNRVPGATIRVMGTRRGVAADEKGAFKIEAVLNERLEITSVGFVSRTFTVNDFSSKNFVLEFYHGEIQGDIILVETRPRKRKDKSIPPTTKIIDTAFKTFKVYPNPAQNNSYVKIDCSKLENGEYVVSIIDMSGEVLQTQEIVIDSKKKQIDFYLDKIAKGAYVVHLFNRKTTASYSEKIIVQ